MAYRQPGFMVDHSLSFLALSAISARNASALTDASKRAFIDQRPGPAGSFVATGANAGIEFDTGSSLLGNLWNRAVIPRGHNLAGETLEVIADTTAGMATPTVRSTGAVPAGTGVIDRALTVQTGDRYWGIQVTTSSAETFDVGEFWIGTKRDLTDEAHVAPNFALELVEDTAQERFGGRETVVALSPARFRHTLEVVNVASGSTDYATLILAVVAGIERPFWYWPPDDAFGPHLVQMASRPTIAQEFPAPRAGIRYRFRFEMLEQLT